MTETTSPETPEEVAAALARATEDDLAIVPRGGGTKIGWGGEIRKDHRILETGGLDAIVAFEPGDMTVTVQAGATFASVQGKVREGGCRILAEPPFPERATLGGILATASTGPIHVRWGDLVLGMQIAYPEGGLVRTGGRTVKNVAGFDLHKACLGSFGTLGVITEATLRLFPEPVATRVVQRTLPEWSPKGILDRIRETPARPAWTVIEEGSEGRILHVLFEGEEAAVEEHVRALEAVLDASGAGPFKEEGVEGMRERIREFPHSLPGRVPCRIGIPRSGIPDLLEALSDWPLMAHVESGLVYAAVLGGVDPVRSIVGEHGGYLVVEGPGDVWGPPRADLHLMEALKQEYDPAGVLSPGRFLGGI
jgi:glycolate oxidase FAD binding subunit